MQAHIGRCGVDWTAKFGTSLATGFADLPVDIAIVDGELVAVDAAGAPDFSAVQDALATRRTAGLVYYAFDLYLDGRDLRPVPLVVCREALAGLITAPGCIRFSEAIDVEGERLVRNVCRLGLEGAGDQVAIWP